MKKYVFGETATILQHLDVIWYQLCHAELT